MAKFSVGYTSFPASPTAAFPQRTEVRRPILPVALSRGKLYWAGYVVVDSGADDLVFPGVVAQRLGFDLASGAYYEFAGAGSRNQSVWFFPVTLHIGSEIRYKTLVGFSQALSAIGMGLLGQNGFFDRFKIEFDLKLNLFSIET